MRTTRPSLAFVALLALGLAACGGEGADTGEESAAPSDTAAADTTEGATAGLSTGGTVAEMTVVNPMPHAMTVQVEFEGGGSNSLGTIPANGTQSFRLAASPGETIRLIASDEEESHSPSTRLTLEERNEWTIGE